MRGVGSKQPNQTTFGRAVRLGRSAVGTPHRPPGRRLHGGVMWKTRMLGLIQVRAGSKWRENNPGAGAVRPPRNWSVTGRAACRTGSPYEPVPDPHRCWGYAQGPATTRRFVFSPARRPAGRSRIPRVGRHERAIAQYQRLPSATTFRCHGRRGTRSMQGGAAPPFRRLEQQRWSNDRKRSRPSWAAEQGPQIDPH